MSKEKTTALQLRIAELEADLKECRAVSTHWHAHTIRLQAENKRLRLALKRIAPTSCPKCGDRSVQQIARDVLCDTDAAMGGK